MKRRDFLTSAGLAAVAAPLAAPALAQSKRVLRMATCWPKNFPGVGTSAQMLADRIERLTGGAVSVKLYAAGELVPPFEVMNAVASGAADIAHSTPYYWAGQAKALNYFTTIPYGLCAPELSGWLRYGGGQALWDEVYKPFGVRGFYCGNSGVQAGGWFRKEINSVDDLKGLKMRIAGLGGAVMQALGVTPVMTPPGEIFPSLMSGVVDAAEWVGPWNDIAMGLYKAAEYYYLPAFHEPGPALEMLVSEKLWAESDPAMRAIFEEAAGANADASLAEFTWNNIQSMQALEEKGVKVRRFPDEVVAALGAQTKIALEELAATDELTGRVHASYMDFLRKAARYGGAMDGVMFADRAAVWG